jgi:hypothetical protein
MITVSILKPVYEDKLDTKTDCLGCPENWILGENHRVESLWVSLRGWWNNERTNQRIEQIELILAELYFEKHGINKK